MQPEEHLKKINRNNKKSRYSKDVLLVTLFILFFYFIGPLIHEIGHLAVIILQSCSYDFSISFTFIKGIYGSIQPLCYLPDTSRLIFYISGHFSVLFTAIIFLINFERTKNVFSGVIGTGLLVSMILALGNHSDIYNAFSVVNLGASFSFLFKALIVLGVSITCLKIWQQIFDILERQ